MTKVIASEAATRCVSDGMQVLGGYSYMIEYGMERYWREVKLNEIAGGRNQIQRVDRGKGLRGAASGAHEPQPAGVAPEPGGRAQTGGVAVDDDHAGLGHGELPLEILLGQLRVEEDRHRAELPDPVHRGDELRATAGQNADAVPLGDSLGGQGGGDAARPPVQVAVAHLVVPDAERGLHRSGSRPMAQLTCEVHRGTLTGDLPDQHEAGAPVL
jgi:hypothetical protein